MTQSKIDAINTTEQSVVTDETVHLAIETTGRLGSIALFQGVEVVESVNLDPHVRTASSLAPEIHRLLTQCRENGRMPQFLSVADGPGSFTGLRIGVTTAKSLGYAFEIPLVAVDSLAAIAAAAFGSADDFDTIAVALDAYRSQVFTGMFHRDQLLPDLQSIPSEWSAHPPGVAVMPTESWAEIRDHLPDDTRLTGDSKMMGTNDQRLVSRSCDALGVGVLGFRAALTRQWTDAMQLVPRYLKPSAAEEKAAAKS